MGGGLHLHQAREQPRPLLQVGVDDFHCQLQHYHHQERVARHHSWRQQTRQCNSLQSKTFHRLRHSQSHLKVAQPVCLQLQSQPAYLDHSHLARALCLEVVPLGSQGALMMAELQSAFVPLRRIEPTTCDIGDTLCDSEGGLH
jgi:hypothetical protein